MTTQIPTQAEYEARERAMFQKQIQATVEAPLADRKESAKDWRETIEAFGAGNYLKERTFWLLQGAYGFGSYQAAHDVARNKRVNRAAWFGQMIAALDHHCPPASAAAVFVSLPCDRQERINAAITTAIEEWLADNPT